MFHGIGVLAQWGIGLVLAGLAFVTVCGLAVGYLSKSFKVPYTYNCPVSKLWHTFNTDNPIARMFYGLGILEGKKQTWKEGE